MLGHVVRGQLNKQIAGDLDIHERTVKLHRTAITTKLRVQSVAELTRLTDEAGLFRAVRAHLPLRAVAGGPADTYSPRLDWRRGTVRRHIERRPTMVRRTIAALSVLMMTGVAAYGQGQQPTERETKALNLQAYAELLRSDVRTQKIAIIAQVMGFTEAEDAAFWPIYREYDAEMSKLGDERVGLIAEYASNYSTLTDAIAEKLAATALDLEARRQAAKARCYDRVKKALSPRTALRFLQVEHQLQLLIDLQISASLPIVK